MENSNTVPKWFTVVAVLALLWNLMGLGSFFMHVFISEEALAVLPEAERNLYGQFPLWTEVVFAIAVLGGTLGSLGLLMRKAWAKPLFWISLVAIIIQMSHNLFMTDAMEVYGNMAALMPTLVVAIGIFMVWLSNKGVNLGWLK
ncbi:hypothetical protein [Sediminicola luteus]|uniref:Sugar transporter n=1 Tax=Sediminicola luteus TaxID=319238 RepID=A0A2A4GFG6_9FLAO|nr:hypothetical protein [Sediminicola luteus]PCE66696.1 hypothetical protein B7P33_05240 [Sediminicola luteus]